jgi:hypothetical protein
MAPRRQRSDPVNMKRGPPIAMLFMLTIETIATDGIGSNPVTPAKKPAAHASTSILRRSTPIGVELALARR